MSEETHARVVGHVDIDCFFAAAEILRRPELNGLPVAVGGTSGRGVVATANYEARAFGIHSAMPVSRALSLCRALIVLPGDFGWYRELSYEMLAVATELSSVIEPAGMDEAYLGFGGEVTWENARARAEEIRARVLARTGLVVSLGMAPTRASAKLASASAKPNGVVVVKPETVKSFLARQGLGKLPGLGEMTRAKLTAAGILTVEALLEASELDLVTAVGLSAATHLRATAMGQDSAEVTSRPAQISVGAEETLTTDVHTRGEFDLEVARMAKSAVARLVAQGLGARSVILKVRSSSFSDHTRSRTLSAPTSDMSELERTAHELGEAGWVATGGHVRLIGVSFGGLTNAVQLRLDLEGRGAVDTLVGPVPGAGSMVRHSVFGDGQVAVSSPEAAIVRFTDKVRVIQDPRRFLTALA
jgi:DNA polymerase-4